MISKYAIVNALMYKDGKLKCSEDDGDWEDVEKETLTGEPIQGNFVLWAAWKGIDFISDIKLKNPADAKYFDWIKVKYGGNLWIAKMKRGEPIPEDYDIYYSISFKPTSEKDIQIVDPRIRPKPPRNFQ